MVSNWVLCRTTTYFVGQVEQQVWYIVWMGRQINSCWVDCGLNRRLLDLTRLYSYIQPAWLCEVSKERKREQNTRATILLLFEELSKRRITVGQWSTRYYLVWITNNRVSKLIPQHYGRPICISSKRSDLEMWKYVVLETLIDV